MKKGSRKPMPKINPRKGGQCFGKSVKIKPIPVVVYDKAKSVLKAIKNKCLWCSGDSYNEAKLCPNTSCLLWPFRLGKNPFSTRGANLTDEQRQAAAERLKKAREVRFGKKQVLEQPIKRRKRRIIKDGPSA